MKKNFSLISLFVLITISISSQNIDSLKLRINKIEQSLIYKRGIISLDSGNAVLTVPNSYKFLNRSQSIFVLTKIYGNPIDSSVIGMLVPNEKGILDQDGWVFTISYNEIGYINEINVNEINIEVLLKDLKKDIIEENKDRLQKGFSSVKLIGWASPPYFDEIKNALQWAKEIKFGNDNLNTLNYNIRILGRKGIYVLNAVATMNQLEEVKTNINEVVESIQFKEGYKYSNYNARIDRISSWSLIDLIRGKLPEKDRSLNSIVNYWKIIVLAIAAFAGTYILIIISRKRKKSSINLRKK